MKFLNVKNKLQLSILLILSLFLLSCRNEIVGEYVGIDETKSDEVKLILNHDNSFNMNLFLDGNYNRMPQETLVGDWEKDGNQLKLITQNNVIIYEQSFENYTIAGKSFKIEIYKFKTCKEESFASNFNLMKDRNVEE